VIPAFPRLPAYPNLSPATNPVIAELDVLDQHEREVRAARTTGLDAYEAGGKGPMIDELKNLDKQPINIERDKINQQLQEVIDEQSDPWGVKVSMVEVKHVDLPEVMQRAMAKQAESERERRAKVIHAEGEHQAAAKLRDAASTIEKHPMAMQMRFLQTLVDVGAENNTTIVFPIPLDLIQPLLQGASAANGKPRTSGNGNGAPKNPDRAEERESTAAGEG